MKKLACLLLLSFLTLPFMAQQQLRPNAYLEAPLGAIRAKGWLLEMLQKQKTGATGNLDQLYPQVMNQRNGWLGGDGDQWERGPYWIDGLLPLAYILDDQELIAKTKPWVEWAISSQREDGYFGPAKDYPNEPGIQRDNAQDWWPKMVMLKILKQYYMATRDKRVITMLTRYFRYQLKELPAKPLDHWTFWARYRVADNMMVVYWLYRITGDTFLLELGDLLHRQGFDFTRAFAETDLLARPGSIHTVNLAQGLKEPLVYYQQHPEEKYLAATGKGLADLKRFNGMAHGLWGGDETLHGNNPTQGSEFCAAVEMMFSLESMLEISGNLDYADQLEKIAFNALPTQASDDFMTRQYFQQANQVMATRHLRNFEVNHHGTDLCFGLLSGYPCCTSNMHQGWPKFTQNLWYNTPDSGIAALVYSPSEFTTTVKGNRKFIITEETAYPFEENIRFRFTAAASRTARKDTAGFDFQLRIPAWCKKATVLINGKEAGTYGPGLASLYRNWKNGDLVELRLPMHVYKNNWYERSRSIERGPLVYALKLDAKAELVKNTKDPVDYGKEYTELRPVTPWNYALVNIDDRQLDSSYRLETTGLRGYPWNPENAPLRLKARARKLPSWSIYNDMTGPIPYSPTYQMEIAEQEEEIILIPYGCTDLRISQFPVVPPGKK